MLSKQKKFDPCIPVGDLGKFMFIQWMGKKEWKTYFPDQIHRKVKQKQINEKKRK